MSTSTGSLDTTPTRNLPLWENEEARHVLDSMVELFIALDRNYDVVFANKAFLTVTEGRDFLGKNHWDSFPEMRGSIVEESYARAFKYGVPVHFTYQHEPTKVWVDVNAHPAGEHLHIYFRDITREKLAEQDLASREETLRSLIDAVPHIAWVTSPDGAMVYINRRWREFTGTDGMDLQQIRDSIHPDDIDRVTDIMSESRKTGFHRPYDLRLRGKDGEYRSHRVKATLMGEPTAGTGYWIGTSTDVHEELLAYESLRESEDHYRFRIASSPQIPWLADPQGRIYDFGQQWLELTGMDRETALQSQATILHPDDAPGMFDKWTQCLADGKDFAFEHRIRVADGSYRWMHSSAKGRRDEDGEVVRWYGHTEDVHDRKQAAQRLESTQQSLALAMKGGRMGWWMRDLATEEVTWSSELEGLFGLPPGGFSGTEENFLSRVVEEDRDKVWTAVRQAIKNRTDYSVEFRFRKPSGEEGWMDGRGMAVYDEEGRATRLYGIGIDITERKNAEQALLESERRLRSLVDQSPIAIQTFAPDGSCTSANPAWEALWGVGRENLVGYNILEDPQLAEIGMAELIREGFQGQSARLEPVCYDPARIGKPGRKRWVEARIYPITRADSLLEVVLLLEDITAQVEAVESAKAGEVRFQTLADVVPDFVWACDSTGLVTYMNAQFQAYTGMSPREFQARGRELLHPEDLERVYERWTAALLSGNDLVSEYRLRSADLGEYRWFLNRGVPVRNSEGDIVQWYGIITDVQAQKEQAATLERLVAERTHELELAYKEQESFSYSVSHDLRTPLRAIVGTARMLQEDHGRSLNAEARLLLDRQTKAANKMAALIDDILELSRVGRRELDIQSLSVSGVFAAVADAMEVPDNLRIEVRPDLRACADPLLLQLVAQNLLENAVKFSPGGGLVEVGKNKEAFYVRDGGVGFSMEFIHKLFQPFQRLHREDEFAGTGIGLATVRRIVERHGGRVWAESEPGKGSVFYFTLPAAS